jgi:glycosyltransferase involved in cell wall biosynthesis
MRAVALRAGAGRIVFDVSTVLRWLGPPVGIVRVEHALAAYALRRRPDIRLSLYDAATAGFRIVNPAWADLLIGWDGALASGVFETRRRRGRLRNLLSPRFHLFMALERWRLTLRRRPDPKPAMLMAIDAAQKLLFASRRLPAPFMDKAGRRLDIVLAELAIGPAIALGPGDILVSAGSDWFHKDAVAIGDLQRRLGFRHVVLCYDLIPLLFPDFFSVEDVARFRRHWQATFAQADKVLVNSHRVESDIRAYCAAEGLDLGETEVVPLGFDPQKPSSAGPSPALPAGLEHGRFALFVSTIEPRKGHALLLRAWRRLLAAGLPQRHGFKLVFLGRRGWLVDELLGEIDRAAGLEGTLLHLEEVEDGGLAGIYDAAAFCLYPSLYEGFGLPVIEAFAHGKAVLASTGGALPETVGGLSPCLDPKDEDAWVEAIGRWIEDPAARAPHEAHIRREFSHPDWEQAAARFFEAAARAGKVVPR